MSSNRYLRAGIIGGGREGNAHARVYNELDNVRLIGVSDINGECDESISNTYDVRVLPTDDLLDKVDIVSVTVPIEFHHQIASQAIDKRVHMLVEQPYGLNTERGRKLRRRAADAGVVFQIGNVERFNPAVRTLMDVVTEKEVIAIEARRLGPPVDRDNRLSVVQDLMIHDIDIICSMFDDDVVSVHASGTANGMYADASIKFENGIVAGLTASRVTQQEIRDLSVVTQDCTIFVDYLEQSVDIHHQLMPEHIEVNGDFRYRHESVIEKAFVESTEPLNAELTAFVTAVAAESAPTVTTEEGVRALEIASRIEAAMETGAS
ncbi:Gfo/Idh/MocA family protein [Halorarius litoreus]|uniref:Gfo/Idh/MocA family protein n=1 Tax=Halorarius litoreus TaxID=2962676 RepID=UPI0020CD8285|nr:Gfo/Idh/MocA family oxidoreductase [Halorarius litoreus]